MAKRVLTGCRDCRKCSTSGVGKAGRGAGRTFAALATVGMSEMAMATTKDCGACGHALSLHQDEKVQGWAQKSGSSNPAAKIKIVPATGSLRFQASLDQLWEALLGGMDEKAIKKRDATSVRVKFGGGLNGPAALLQATIESAPDGTARLRYTIDAGMLMNAQEGAAAVRINDKIRDEEASMLIRLESALGPSPDSAPSVPAASEAPSAEEIGPTAPVATSDPVEQIKKLAELRDAGILTEEEFAAKKAEILARM